MKQVKIKEEPKNIVRNIYYGDKKLVECMKAVIKSKLGEGDIIK